MEKKSYTIAIDLGSSKVAVAAGVRNAEGLVDVAALAVKPVEGVNAGRIDNIELVSRAIKAAVDEVEEELGIRITEAYAGISGEFVRCARHTDHVFVYDPQNGVSRHDVDALFDRMRNVQAPDDETIMERVPQNYVVDDAQEVKNPVGSFGKKLSSTFNFILCQRTPMQRLDMALRRLGIRLLAVYPDAVVTPEAVLTPDEKEEGVAVIDLGAGTTDVAVYYRNVLRYVATVPMGASAINSDIRSLSVPEKYVESLKCKYGSAVAELAPENKLIRVSGRTAKEAKDILLRNLATVIEARAMDIVEFVMQELKDSGYIQKLAFGLVLTGGSSRLKDVGELFHRTTGMDVRVGAAEGNLTDEARERLADPALATVAGILMRGAESAPCAVGERPRVERPAQTEQRPASTPASQPAPEAPRRPSFVPPAEPQRSEARYGESHPSRPTATPHPQSESPRAGRMGQPYGEPASPYGSPREQQPRRSPYETARESQYAAQPGGSPEPSDSRAEQPAYEQPAYEQPRQQPSAEPEEPRQQTKRPGLLERMKRTLKNSAEVLNKKFEPGEDEEI